MYLSEEGQIFNCILSGQIHEEYWCEDHVLYIKEFNEKYAQIKDDTKAFALITAHYTDEDYYYNIDLIDANGERIFEMTVKTSENSNTEL